MRAYDITKSVQDLRYLSWDEAKRPSGFFVPEPTAREGVGDNAILYRMNAVDSRSSYGAHGGVAGANELIACRLMDAMDIPHVDTRLIHAQICLDTEEQTQWITRYKNLREPNGRLAPIDVFFELSSDTGETPLGMCVRMGWDTSVAQMMIVDYLTANRGRNGSNLYVQANPEGKISLAPVYGGRQSLTSSFIGQTWRINATADIGTENYLGSQSLEENLEWAVGVLKARNNLPTCKHEKPAADSTKDANLPCEHLTERTRRELFRSLNDIFPPMTAQQEGSWQIIRKRWERYARLCRL